MQQREKVQKLVEWFAKAAVRHREAIEAMQEGSASAQVADLRRFYAAVKREGGIELFLALLENDDPSIAGMAAVYAMRDAPGRCTVVLTRLAKEPGLTGFRAKVALERWESGDWPDEV